MRFLAKREMFMYYGKPRSACNMVRQVARMLGTDIVKWLQQPSDEVILGDR